MIATSILCHRCRITCRDPYLQANGSEDIAIFSVGGSGDLQKPIVILMISVTTIDNPEQYNYTFGKMKIQYYAHLTSIHRS